METNAICRLHFLCIHCNSFVPRDCLFDFRNVYFYCDARPKRKPSGDASKSELHGGNKMRFWRVFDSHRRSRVSAYRFTVRLVNPICGGNIFGIILAMCHPISSLLALLRSRRRDDIEFHVWSCSSRKHRISQRAILGPSFNSINQSQRKTLRKIYFSSARAFDRKSTENLSSPESATRAVRSLKW